MSEAISKREDIIDRLMDCQREAFHVGLTFLGDNKRGFEIFQKTFEDAAREIAAMRAYIKGMQRAINAEGYDVMVNVDGGFAGLAERPADCE